MLKSRSVTPTRNSLKHLANGIELSREENKKVARQSSLSALPYISNRGKVDLNTLTPANIVALQQTIGNQAVMRLLAQKGQYDTAVTTHSTSLQGSINRLEIEVGIGHSGSSEGKAVQRALHTQISYADDPDDNLPVSVKLQGHEGPVGNGAVQGSVQSADVARHIVPSHLLIRNLQAEYNGKTVGQIKSMISYVPNPNGFRATVQEKIKSDWDYQNARLNREVNYLGVPTDSWMPKASHTVPHATSADDNRNFWMGESTENGFRSNRAINIRNSVDQLWNNTGLGNDPSTVNTASPAYTNFKAATDVLNKQWMALEFDPPPNKPKAHYQQMAEVWLNFTKDWLQPGTLDRLKYWPNTGLAWHDVYEYNNTNKLYFHNGS